MDDPMPKEACAAIWPRGGICLVILFPGLSDSEREKICNIARTITKPTFIIRSHC